MINEFIDYYNEEKSVFADGVGTYSDANTSVEAAYSYGFITVKRNYYKLLSLLMQGLDVVLHQN